MCKGRYLVRESNTNTQPFLKITFKCDEPAGDSLVYQHPVVHASPYKYSSSADAGSSTHPPVSGYPGGGWVRLGDLSYTCKGRSGPFITSESFAALVMALVTCMEQSCLKQDFQPASCSSQPPLLHLQATVCKWYWGCRADTVFHMHLSKTPFKNHT